MKPLTAAMVAVQQNAELLRGASGQDGKDGDPGVEGKAAVDGLTWRGTFAYGTTYQPGDVVEWEGSSYVALVVTARRPPDPEWDLLAAKGEAGASGRGYIRGGGGSGSGSALAVKDEGVSLTAAAASFDFAGAGVTATAVGGAVTVTVAGGATSLYVQDADPGAVGAGKLWINTTTPGPPWDAQVRNAADDGWEDFLGDYLSTGEVRLQAAPDGSGATGARIRIDVGDGDNGGDFTGFGGNGVDGASGGKASLSGGDGDATTGSPAKVEANGGGIGGIGGNATAIGGAGIAGAAGGEAHFGGGSGDSGADLAASMIAHGGSGTGDPGKLEVLTNGSTGVIGQALVSDGVDRVVWGSALAGSAQTYTETNVTTDRAFNANATTLDEIADVLGSLIVDLRARGVVA